MAPRRPPVLPFLLAVLALPVLSHLGHAQTPPPPAAPTAAPSLQEVCSVTESPAGLAYAAAVIAYDPRARDEPVLEPGPEFRDPQRVLGPPDADPTTFLGALSLGHGGSLTVQFVDPSLGGEGTAAPDLWVCEVVPPDAEGAVVAVSADGDTWQEVGRVGGGTSGLDLDAIGIGPQEGLRFVRLTDDPVADPASFGSPGLDIDAVAVRLPSPGAPPMTPAVTGTAVPAGATTPPPAGDLAAVQATIAAQATRIAELEGALTPPTIAPTATPVPTSTPDPAQATIAAQAARIATLEAGIGVTPTVPPEPESPQIVLQADTTQLRVGEEVRVHAGLTGLGLPLFYVGVHDAGIDLPVALVRIDATGQVQWREGASQVLEVVEASGEASGFAATLEITLRAVDPGEAAVTVGATGEVCTPDGVCAWGGAGSDPLLIEVSEDSVDVATPTRAEPATETPLAADFVTPDPAACTVAPRSAEEIAALASSPDQAELDAVAATILVPGLEIPMGSPADDVTSAAVVETYRQMTACFNAGNDLAAYALWTDAALRQLPVAPPADAPAPLPEGERLAFRVTDVLLLPDGRVAAVWEERGPVSSSAVQVLVRQDSGYRVDETLDIMFE